MYYIEGQINPPNRKDGSDFIMLACLGGSTSSFLYIGKDWRLRGLWSLSEGAAAERLAFCIYRSLTFPAVAVSYIPSSSRCVNLQIPIFSLFWQGPSLKREKLLARNNEIDCPHSAKGVSWQPAFGHGPEQASSHQRQIWDIRFPHTAKTPLSTWWAADLLGGTGSGSGSIAIGGVFVVVFPNQKSASNSSKRFIYLPHHVVIALF